MDRYKPLTTHQAERLRQKYGFNEIISPPQKTVFGMFFSQFANIFIAILAGATILSFILQDILDGSFILAIIILNSVLGFLQEYKAEKAVEKLKNRSIFVTRVIRDGQEQEIDNRRLVPGDIIVLEAGSKVPADALLLEALNFEIDEALLTGESIPVIKHPSDPQANRIYMGTIVMKGRCKAVVIAIGMDTKFGKLTKTLAAIQEPPTKLSKYITNLGKQLSFAGIAVGIVIFIVPLLHHEPLLITLLTSISLVVAVVPEGLPAIITIALATGASRMAKKHVIIRKMSAIETLGEVSVIATDKTGTITHNKMEVKNFWIDNKSYLVDQELPPKTNKTFEKFLEISILCNNAQLFYKEYSSPEIVGDQTEGALMLLADTVNIKPDVIKQSWLLVDEFAFLDATKTMTVIYKKDHKITAFTKGAPESIIALSSKIYHEGVIRTLTQTEKEVIQTAYQEYAREGLRLIAMAYKELPEKIKKYSRSEVESELIFTGFAGIADPVRPEVKNALRQTRNAGITTVMITGDNELTARTIAIEIGLIEKDDQVITGAELDKLSDKKLASLISETKVFARCTPDHKLRIVKAYQQQKHIVAVTGDGINDALCLKQANVGIAMGITGTDVTREAADVVITDDNFATIVAGIEEGRTIFDNIRKSISYLLSGNLSEILTIGIAIVCGFPGPLLPVHILWMNVVTDGLPAIALALDTKHPDVMKRPPPDHSLSLITKEKAVQLGILSIAGTLSTLAVFGILLQTTDLKFARTAAFTLLIIFEMIIAFLVKEKNTWYTNKLLFLAVALALLSQLLILTIPFLQTVFQVGW